MRDLGADVHGDAARMTQRGSLHCVSYRLDLVLAEIAVPVPAQTTPKLNLGRVGDALPVAVLAHGLDERGDVVYERPVPRIVSW